MPWLIQTKIMEGKALLLQKGYLKCTVASKEAYRLPHFVFNFGKTVYVD